jgi:hypothetical protein
VTIGGAQPADFVEENTNEKKVKKRKRQQNRSKGEAEEEGNPISGFVKEESS